MLEAAVLILSTPFEQVRCGLQEPRHCIVEEYAEENDKSAKGIMRRLNDNPDQWKE
jgi:hypothetical protein